MKISIELTLLYSYYKEKTVCTLSQGRLSESYVDVSVVLVGGVVEVEVVIVVVVVLGHSSVGQENRAFVDT